MSAAIGPMPKQRRRLRKHRNQVFQTPKRGERRKGSHKNSYKHNEEEYPAYLSGFYGYYDEPTEEPVPTSFPTYYYYDHDHHYYHHDTYDPTYHPTYHPTQFPTFVQEQLVYEYSGYANLKGAKKAKSKGVKQRGSQTKHAPDKSHKKAKGVYHGPVYEIIYEDGYEETLVHGHHPETYPPGDFHDDGEDGYEPHHHDHEITDSVVGHGHKHRGPDYDHSHLEQGYNYHPDREPTLASPRDSDDEAHRPPPIHRPPALRSNGYDDLCNSKGKKGSKGRKQKNGAYYYYHEPVEIMDYDCVSRSKNKSKSKGKKSKSKGRGTMTIRPVRPTPAPRETPFPTLFEGEPIEAPVPFGEKTPVPSSKGSLGGNETWAPTDVDTGMPTEPGMNMGPPLPATTDPTPAETMEPTTLAPMEVTVELIPFGLLYDIDRANVPNEQDYEEARVVIEQYINMWFARGYNGTGESQKLFVSAVIINGNTAYSLISGAFSDYSGNTVFRDDFVIPLPSELDTSLDMAFEQPFLQELLDLFATELPPTNIFSTATNIRKVENSETGVRRKRNPSRSSRFTIQKGILMVAAFGMLGILLYGGIRMWIEHRRQTRIAKTGAFFGGDDILMGNNYDGFLIAR